MKTTTHSFSIFLWRVSALHIISYFVIGIVSMSVFTYKELFAFGNLGTFMKPLDSPWVALGPGLQVFRGIIFALVLWPFQSIFINEKYGWLKLWTLFIGLGILATFGPSMGSVDGFIYTTIPIKHQLLFLPELLSQSLLLSISIYFWYQKPKRMYTIISIVFVTLIFLMSIAGFLSYSN